MVVNPYITPEKEPEEQPEKKSEADEMWESVMSAGKRSNVL